MTASISSTKYSNICNGPTATLVCQVLSSSAGWHDKNLALSKEFCQMMPGRSWWRKGDFVLYQECSVCPSSCFFPAHLWLVEQDHTGWQDVLYDDRWPQSQSIWNDITIWCGLDLLLTHDVMHESERTCEGTCLDPSCPFPEWVLQSADSTVKDWGFLRFWSDWSEFPDSKTKSHVQYCCLRVVFSTREHDPWI